MLIPGKWHDGHEGEGDRPKELLSQTPDSQVERHPKVVKWDLLSLLYFQLKKFFLNFILFLFIYFLGWAHSIQNSQARDQTLGIEPVSQQ